ncbi:MAG TPA: hypothetical protein VFZ40_09530 [Pyrinomonadaceae bacterium]
MNTKKLTAIVVLTLLTALSGGAVSSQKRSALNPEQQRKFLARRLPSGAITGTFAAFGSFLYAALDIAVHTNDKAIADAELHSPFPDFYKPTTKELLDTIALQTKSSWAYDSQTDYWTFAKPAAAKPFSVTLAGKWTRDDRGFYVSYRPPAYPVGMDIYYYGTYSADDPSQQLAVWERVRNSWAIGFASHLKRGVTISEMQRVSIDGTDAIYFQAPAPRPGVIWRQWALVKDGHAFVIVSSLPTDDRKLLADVESMVKSFRVTYATPSKSLDASGEGVFRN